MTLLQGIYTRAIRTSLKLDQVVGDKHDYYITLEQLEEILNGFEERSRYHVTLFEPSLTDD